MIGATLRKSRHPGPKPAIPGFVLSTILSLALLQTGCGDDSTQPAEPVCGNGIIEQGEECDDGAANSDSTADACRTNCVPAHCGDGVADSGEECDGNDLGSQSCDSLGLPPGTLTCTSSCNLDTSGCQSAQNCGNGIVEEGEECDEGEANSDSEPDACRTDCHLAHCGDGVTDSDEECDASGQDTADCDGDCTFVVCGDGHVNPAAREECDDGNAVVYDGCDQCQATEFIVNTFTSGEQADPKVAVGGNGRFVVVWTSQDQDGDGLGVFGQLYDETGLPMGAEFQVNTYTEGSQRFPRVAMAADGSFMVVWSSQDQDGSSWGAYGQAYDPSGAPAGSEFQVSPRVVGPQIVSSVTATPDGDFLAVWMEDTIVIYASRFDSSGNRQGLDFELEHTPNRTAQAPFVTMGQDGTYLVTWAAQGTGTIGQDILCRRFDSSDEPIEDAFMANSTQEWNQHSPKAAIAPDGSFAVVWTSDNQDNDGSSGVVVQYFDASGTPVAQEYEIHDHTDDDQNRPSVGALPDGAFMLAWESLSQDGDSWGIYARRFDPTAQDQTDAFQVNSYTTQNQERPNLAAAANGSFVVVWQSSNQAPDASASGIFGVLYHEDGTKTAPGRW